MEKLCDNIYRFDGGDDSAYLIVGDTNVLIDGVREDYSEEYAKAICSVVDFSDIEYIIFNHTEPNRSGTFEAVLRKNPDIEVIASTAGLKFLSELTELPFNAVTAKDGMEIDINGEALTFILAPYLNWPDTMMTLYKDILFAPDIFGKDNVILEPSHLKSAIDSLRGHKIRSVLSGTGKILSGEDVFGFDVPCGGRDGTLILYSSVYGTVREMAETVYSLIRKRRKNAEIYDIEKISSAEAAEKVNKASCLMIGVNTVNADAPTKMWDIIARTNKLINKHKKCMIFGAYGWSGEGLYYMEKHLKLLRYDVYEKPFGVVLKMKSEDRKKLCEYMESFMEYMEKSC